MGIRIITPDGADMVIKPFSKSLRVHTVQLWCYLQKNTCALEFREAVKTKKPLNAFILEFSIEEFTTLSKISGGMLHAFALQLIHKTSLSYSQLPVYMDAAMHQCIYQLTHEQEPEDAGRLHAYARVIKLAALFQTNYHKAHTTTPVFIKNEYDKERILYARDYLITHMDAPPALPELAAIVGINEFKLKRGFKEMFNHTPYGYLADVRLEMARTALRKKEKNITQIAFELGYASLQHFSMAFKKKFGCSPSDYI